VTIDVVGLGVAALDDILYLGRDPILGDKTRVVSRERHVGGLTAYALMAASRLGASCVFAGRLGTGQDSAAVVAALNAAGISTDRAARIDGAGPVLSTIVIAPDGTRTIFFDDSRTAGPPDEVDLELVSSAAVVVVDGHGVPGAIRAARHARGLGIPIVGDCESVQHERLPELLDLVDHLILPESFAIEVSGAGDAAAAVAALWRSDRQLVAVTMGERGCVYRTRHTVGVETMPAFLVDAIDTSGCGDIFHGAYAAALASHAEPSQALRFASAATALSAASRGGPERLPTRSRVDALAGPLAMEVHP